MKLRLTLLIFLAAILFMGASSGREEINISSLSLEKKIGQMFIVGVDEYDERYTNLGIGGIFINSLKTKEEYRKLISQYQNNSNVKLFVSTDLEGYWNPFPFFKSKNFGEVENSSRAFELGKSHGIVLKELGFNLDFSPVVEVRNKVWPGRSFTGTNKEIEDKITAYINGLQKEGVMATAKHYPGGNMVRDPHWFFVRSRIYDRDLRYFDLAIEENVSAIMVGHSITHGAVDSNYRQSSVSNEIVSGLRENYDGLIITDAIRMWGLTLSYFFRPWRMHTDLVKAGNDIILDSYKTSPRKVEKGILNIKKAVESGKISRERIDDSAARILRNKGYKVVR